MQNSSITRRNTANSRNKFTPVVAFLATFFILMGSFSSLNSSAVIPEYSVEIEEMRTEYSKTFKVPSSERPSGYKYTVETYSDKIHYKDNSRYREINNNLYDNGETFKNTANDFEVRFGKNFGEGFAFVSNQLDIKFGKVSLYNQGIQLDSNNSAGTIQANKVVYTSIVDGVDFEYECFIEECFQNYENYDELPKKQIGL